MGFYRSEELCSFFSFQQVTRCQSVFRMRTEPESLIRQRFFPTSCGFVQSGMNVRIN